jgi:hypothetical protein
VAMSTCSSLCGNGVRCGVRAREGSDYCGRHKNSNECPVCYDSSILKPMAKCCHSVCKSCTASWFATHHHTCPLCRTAQIDPCVKYEKLYKSAVVRRFLKRWCSSSKISDSVWFAFFGACDRAGVTDVEFMGWFESDGRKEEYERVTFGW